MESAEQTPGRAGERGQTSVEYVGVILVVVAMLGIILKAAPDLGNQIIDAIKTQIDAILGA